MLPGTFTATAPSTAGTRKGYHTLLETCDRSPVVATRLPALGFQVVQWTSGVDEQAREVETMEPRDGRPITYILPTTAWASLLDVIVREAPAGAVIATYTEAMRARSEQAVARVGRADVVVDVRPSPESAPFSEDAA